LVKNNFFWAKMEILINTKTPYLLNNLHLEPKNWYLVKKINRFTGFSPFYVTAWIKYQKNAHIITISCLWRIFFQHLTRIKNKKNIETKKNIKKTRCGTAWTEQPINTGHPSPKIIKLKSSQSVFARLFFDEKLGWIVFIVFFYWE